MTKFILRFFQESEVSTIWVSKTKAGPFYEAGP